MAAASLNRPSLCSTVISRRGMWTRPATDSTATGSGGATMAPSAMAAGMPMLPIISHAAPATTAVVTTTRATASSTMVRQRTRNTAQELRCAVAIEQRRQEERAGSAPAAMWISGKPGMNVRATANSSISTG